MEVNLRRVNENQALIGGVSFNLVFMHLAGFFVHSASSYFEVTRHLTAKLFPAKTHEASSIAKAMTSEINFEKSLPPFSLFSTFLQRRPYHDMA